MEEPDIDHGLWDDENDFLDYSSPFLDFGFDEGQLVEEYVNRIMHPIATDIEFRLRIHNWQYRLYPHMPMHENFVGLQNLVLPSHTETIYELKRALGFLLPTLNGESDQEPPTANQGSLDDGMYIFTGLLHLHPLILGFFIALGSQYSI